MALVGAVVLSLASAHSSSFTTRTIQAKDGNALFSAALQAFGDEGLTFRNKDREAGIVASEWEDLPTPDSTMQQQQAAMRFTIVDGTGRLFIDCRGRTKGPLEWSDWSGCGDARPDSFIAKANRIEKAIREKLADQPASAPANSQ
jgi:hypothetical protein